MNSHGIKFHFYGICLQQAIHCWVKQVRECVKYRRMVPVGHFQEVNRLLTKTNPIIQEAFISLCSVMMTAALNEPVLKVEWQKFASGGRSGWGEFCRVGKKQKTNDDCQPCKWAIYWSHYWLPVYHFWIVLIISDLKPMVSLQMVRSINLT